MSLATYAKNINAFPSGIYIAKTVEAAHQGALKAALKLFRNGLVKSHRSVEPEWPQVFFLYAAVKNCSEKEAGTRRIFPKL